MSCPVTFFLFFICFWAILSLFFSRIGGWGELAKHYRYLGPPIEKKKHLQSAGMRGLMSYRGCLTIGANQEGLYLAMLFLFRPGHPPLFIPWREIKIGRQKLFGFPVLVFKFTKAPSVHLAVFQSLEDFLKGAAKRDLPFDPALDNTKLLSGFDRYFRFVISVAIIGLLTAMYILLLTPHACRLK